MSDALLEAIQRRDVDRVATLLAAGADPLIEDMDDMTTFKRLGYASLPDDPAAQARLQEIRALLGEPTANV